MSTKLPSTIAAAIKDVISQVLAPDTDEQQQQTRNGPPAQATNQVATQTVTVSLGQSPDQVKPLLGQPEKIMDLGPQKQIYVYKDLKITFIDGKVADVQ